MSTTDPNTLYNEGCSQHDQAGIVVLDFGQPWWDGYNYGSIIFGSNTFRSVWDIEVAAESWIDGWWWCTPSYTPHIRLAIGTSNYLGYTGYGHGQAWAQMVNDVGGYVQSMGYSSQVDVAGASDMELDWNSASITRAWADGYDSADNWPYYNYGDAAGCPPYGSCDNGWRQEDVWYVSWGVLPAYPLPEIYTDATSREWYRLSLYGYTYHGQAILISGTMTQWAAMGYCCTNTPSQGYNQLNNKLNRDWRTRQTIPWSTDITWAN
jgi:hypothetical protein